MKLLRELNDKTIMGQDGLSDKAPRLTARAIVKNQEGLYAVMYSEQFQLYSLPGGGIEDGEEIISALHREVLEETGCICDFIYELGCVKENRACQDYTQISYYYAVYSEHSAGASELTASEKASNTVVQWHTFDDMRKLIQEAKHDTVQKRYLQARDVVALKEFAKQHIDRCHICGVWGKMSFEHIPPEGALNSEPAIMHDGNAILAKQKGEKSRFFKLQQGTGKYTLCEQCNNITGNWYASEYNLFAKATIWHLQQLEAMEHGDICCFTANEMKALAIVKQIITMFCSLLPLSEVRRLGFDEFVLNRETNNLDTTLFDLRIYLTSPEVACLMTGPMVSIFQTEAGIESVCVSDLAVYPFGFILNLSPEYQVKYGTSMLQMFKSEYSKKHKIKWTLQYLERANNEMPLPLMFKSMPISDD